MEQIKIKIHIDIRIILVILDSAQGKEKHVEKSRRMKEMGDLDSWDCNIGAESEDEEIPKWWSGDLFSAQEEESWSDFVAMNH